MTLSRACRRWTQSGVSAEITVLLTMPARLAKPEAARAILEEFVVLSATRAYQAHLNRR
jgi:hypothetical protein